MTGTPDQPGLHEADACLALRIPRAQVRRTDSTPRVALSFFCSYDKFQISQGVAGNALAEAEVRSSFCLPACSHDLTSVDQAVFVRPLDGVDLKTVSQTDLKAMEVNQRGGMKRFKAN